MNSRLSLWFIYQRKIYFTRAVAKAAMARRRLPSPVRGEGGGEGKREVLDEKRGSSHWCGPE
jgi:hypothetical protein